MLAQLYHAHHLPYTEDIPFWLSLAQQQGSPVLELGCGTGRVLLPLAKAGYHVTGLDNDPDALALLRSQLEGPLQANIIESDLTNFHLAQKFPLILLPCNTYSSLSPPQRQQALDCITAHLAPGCVFAFSAPNPAILQDISEEGEPELETTFNHPQTNNPVQVSSLFLPETDGVRITWHYDHLLPDGRVERQSAHTFHYHTPAAQHRAELEKRGFSVETYGDFAGGKYKSDAFYLVLIAKIGYN